MTEVVTDERQSSLRDNARRRQRRNMMLGLLSVGVLVPSTITLGFALGDGNASIRPALLIGVGFALAMCGLIIIVWRVRSQRLDPPLMMGADRATQRAVRRALRDGHSADPDTDLLVRDLIDRSPKTQVPSYTYFGLATLFAILAILGDRDGWALVRSVVLVAACLAAAATFRLQQRRIRNYRTLNPGRAPMPGPVAGSR